MSDRFFAEITIGGTLTDEFYHEFCREVGVGNLHGLLVLHDGEHIVHGDDQVPYGRFDDLEALCRRANLPYSRKSDGMYEHNPEIEFWLPGMGSPDTVQINHAGIAQVDMHDVVQIQEALKAWDIHKALQIAEKAVTIIPDIPPFTLDM